MPGPGTIFMGGPVQTGTRVAGSNGNTVTDIGPAVLSQSVTLVHNGSSAVSATLYVPDGSQIVDIICDTTTAWNSATSDTLSVGTAAAGTQYAGSVDTKTAAGRTRPTFTAAQLTNMLGPIADPGAVVATVTPVGSASAGSTTVTVLYVQTVQIYTGST